VVEVSNSASEPHRYGSVAICGRPNVGKSTLVNALLGEVVLVTTPYPQTTRERVLGIWTGPSFQAVLVDTPGIHRARSALNRFMVAEAKKATRGVDLIVLLAEVPVLGDTSAAEAWTPGPVATEVLELLAGTGRPMLLVLTKVDRLDRRDLLLPVIGRWSALHAFEAIIPVSARTGEGMQALQRDVVSRLPEGPALYDRDQLSDRPLRWHAAELVRAQLFDHLGEELPYSCTVTVEAYEEHDDRHTVRATIHVERDSQKGIVVGRGGKMIKAISSSARERIAELIGMPCELFVEVRVTKNWTKSPELLDKLGYRDREGEGR
jgi:GTP-binding protein Era